MSILCGSQSSGEERDERAMELEGREEAKQGHDSVPLLCRCESIEECARHPIRRDRTCEATPVLTPQRRGGEVLLPPMSPTRQCAPVDPELDAQLGGTARRDAVGHGRHQHHHDTEVHAPTQKAQGRRGLAASASVAVTTEAEPPLLVGRETGGTPARLAEIVGLMEPPTAGASRNAGLVGKVEVQGIEQLEKSGIAQQGMAH